MNKENYDLISLIAENREAMDYFKTLPIYVKSQLSQKADQIGSLDELKTRAGQILNGQNNMNLK